MNQDVAFLIEAEDRENSMVFRFIVELHKFRDSDDKVLEVH